LTSIYLPQCTAPHLHQPKVSTYSPEEITSSSKDQLILIWERGFLVVESCCKSSDKLNRNQNTSVHHAIDRGGGPRACIPGERLRVRRGVAVVILILYDLVQVSRTGVRRVRIQPTYVSAGAPDGSGTQSLSCQAWRPCLNTVKLGRLTRQVDRWSLSLNLHSERIWAVSSVPRHAMSQYVAVAFAGGAMCNCTWDAIGPLKPCA